MIDTLLDKSFRKYGRLINIEVKNERAYEFELTFDKIYVLTFGKAFLSRIEKDGRKIIFDILEEGSILGSLDFLSQPDLNPLANDSLFRNKSGPVSQDPLYIEPLSDKIIRLYEFNEASFLEVLSANPKFTFHILSDLSARIGRLEKKIEAIALSQIKFRLLYELMQLSAPHDLLKDSYKINFKITHEKLAEITGVVRETVSKTITQLKREGFLYYDKEKNMVINLGNIQKKMILF